MPNNALTDDAISSIRRAVSQSQDFGEQHIDEAIFSITSACSGALSREAVGDPRNIRMEISMFLSSIERLLKSANELTLYSHLELEDGFSEEMREDDSDIATFKGSGVTGEGMWGLKVRLRAAKKLAEQALERIDVPRGAPVKIYARELAIAVRQALEEHKINVTSYDDGVYMQVLRVAFSTLLPEAGVESYRRHGKWALSIHDPDNEIDWSTMRIDLSE